MQREREISIGTAGFSFPHWQGPFYPRGLRQGQWLQYYAQHFQSVEINTTFYAEPRASLLGHWIMQVPDDFQFTLKASRLITHDKILKDVTQDLTRMWQQFSYLGSKLSCVLFQLPPFLSVDHGLLDTGLGEIIGTAIRVLSTPPRIAIEFRHPSWINTRTIATLQRHHCTMVLNDMPGESGWTLSEDTESGKTILQSQRLKFTAEEWAETWRQQFTYMRFQGNVGGEQRKEYGQGNLEPWAMFFQRMSDEGIPLYAYFKNDPGGAAIRDALLFQEMLGVKRTESEDVHNAPKLFDT